MDNMKRELPDRPFENSFTKAQREREIAGAKAELTQAKAIKVLLSNNDLAAEISICGIKMGCCNTRMLLPIVEHQIQEIKKFLTSKPNEWE